MPGRQRLRRGVASCRGSTARRRSTRSGRARATSSAWMCCARWRGTRPRWTRCWPSSTGRAAPISGSTPGSIRLKNGLREQAEAGARGAPSGRAAGAGAAGRRCWCGTRRAAVADAFCASRLADGGGAPVRDAAARPRSRRDLRAGAPRPRLIPQRARARPALASPDQLSGDLDRRAVGSSGRLRVRRRCRRSSASSSRGLERRG